MGVAKLVNMDEPMSRFPLEAPKRELGTARGLTTEVEGWDAAKKADEFLELRPKVE
jgi:hypothetical protein